MDKKIKKIKLGCEKEEGTLAGLQSIKDLYVKKYPLV